MPKKRKGLKVPTWPAQDVEPLGRPDSGTGLRSGLLRPESTATHPPPAAPPRSFSPDSQELQEGETVWKKYKNFLNVHSVQIKPELSVTLKD